MLRPQFFYLLVYGFFLQKNQVGRLEKKYNIKNKFGNNILCNVQLPGKRSLRSMLTLSNDLAIVKRQWTEKKQERPFRILILFLYIIFLANTILGADCSLSLGVGNPHRSLKTLGLTYVVFY